jgi:hypothetical protein
MFTISLSSLSLVMEWPAGIIHTWAPFRIPQFIIGVYLGFALLDSSDEKKSNNNDNDDTEKRGSVQNVEQPPTTDLASALVADVLSLTMIVYVLTCYMLGVFIGKIF